MQITRKNLSPTNVKLTVVAGQDQLDTIKQEVLTKLQRDVKLPGFREGKAPLSMVEKNVDQNLLQSEFLEHAVNHIYGDALAEGNLRPVAQPEVNITKYVPFTTLEFEVEIEVFGEVKLPDYRKIKLAKKPVTISAKDVDGVIANLKTRAADKESVTRAAKDGDEVILDFFGTDAKTEEPINGADGKDYPLILGSNTFIPGFEPNLIGLKPGQEKTFVLEFPKDYGVSALQSRKVSFKVAIKQVQKIIEPKLDDAFAAKVGPFKTMAELRADIKKQLESEKQHQAQREYENELVQKIAEKATVAVPKAIVDEELDRQEADERQNLMYRGQTWQEHLKEEGVTEEEHREKKRPDAELRVKAGLVLSEIAEKEGITLSPDELEIRLQIMKGQYQDPAMQAELEKPEAKRDIASRLLTEKTLAKLTAYATGK
jgi:trigger factor